MFHVMLKLRVRRMLTPVRSLKNQEYVVALVTVVETRDELKTGFCDINVRVA